MEPVLVKSQGGWRAAAKLENSGLDVATLASTTANIWKAAFGRLPD